VKYNKQNRVVKSGLGEAGWIGGGKYVYALESSGFFKKTSTISFWEVKK
jgi:hypothetical protein